MRTRKKSKHTLRQIEMKTQPPKSVGQSERSPEREIHSNAGLLFREAEQSQINNLKLHLKELEKEQQTKPKVSRREETVKMETGLNEMELKKKQYKRSLKPRAHSLQR